MTGSHWIWLGVILVIVLIVFGVGRLPEVGGALGRSIRNFRDASREEHGQDKPGPPDGSQQPPA